MWTLIMKFSHTEVKFYPKVKSQTGLSSLRVSCKHGLIVVGLVNSPICAVINVTCAICVIYPSKHLLVQGKNADSKRWEIYSLTSLTSFWCLYCWLWTNFSHFSTVSSVDFEQAYVCLDTVGYIYERTIKRIMRNPDWYKLLMDLSIKNKGT